MKTTTILLLTAITTALSHTVVAENENSAPPSGPYKASNGTEEMNTSPYSNNNVPPMNYPNQFAMQPQQNRFMPNYPQPEIPEWVKQQQAEMEKLRQQQNSQSAGRTNQPLPPEAPEWVKQRQAEMEKLRQQQNSQSAERINQPLPPEAPEWVKQRQAQMEQWMKQSNMSQPQNRNNIPQQQWNNNNQYQAMPNPGYNPDVQANSLHQYFPSARGPVYGPGVPPPGYQNQPGLPPPPHYRNAYPPVWR